jgi:hypothetical protein
MSIKKYISNGKGIFMITLILGAIVCGYSISIEHTGIGILLFTMYVLHGFSRLHLVSSRKDEKSYSKIR